jgi:hypothetical protein
VIWVPNQIFEKSESRGEISKEKSPHRFCELVVSDPPICENTVPTSLEILDREKIST